MGFFVCFVFFFWWWFGLGDLFKMGLDKYLSGKAEVRVEPNSGKHELRVEPRVEPNSGWGDAFYKQNWSVSVAPIWNINCVC